MPSSDDLSVDEFDCPECLKWYLAGLVKGHREGSHYGREILIAEQLAEQAKQYEALGVGRLVEQTITQQRARLAREAQQRRQEAA